MGEQQKKVLTNGTTTNIFADLLDDLASEIDWGEIGTEQTPGRIRCVIENSKIVKILFEWPPGRVVSVKGTK